MKIIFVLALAILIGGGFAFGEDQAINTNPVPASLPAAEMPAAEENAELPNMQWVWGEVASIDAQNKVFSLKYLDYETDQEKEMSLATDESTSYDNVKSLEGIQVKDSLSVDYIVKDGKNIARTIGLEKAEDATSATVASPQATDGNDVQPPQASQ